MNIYIDIETIPGQAPWILDDIRMSLHDKTEKKERAIEQQYKREETVKKHVKRIREGLPDKFEEEHLKTALDPSRGEIICIGMAFDDSEPFAISRNISQPESDVLNSFYSLLPIASSNMFTWVGFNCSRFDMRFIYNRSVINRIKPNVNIPVEIQDRRCFDIMVEWCGRSGFISQNSLCKALGVEFMEHDVNGSNIYEAVKMNQYKEIEEYCMDDVRVIREMHKKMTWQS